MKNNKIHIWIEPDEIAYHKSHRNKRETDCSIKRREGCGICGSPNIAYQGVRYCNVCGEEEPYLSQRNYYLWFKDNSEFEPKCDCLALWTHKKKGKHVKVHWYRSVFDIKVKKCMDCGAVASRFCPNGERHTCWKKGGKLFCLTCGFRV